MNSHNLDLRDILMTSAMKVIEVRTLNIDIGEFRVFEVSVVGTVTVI